MTEPVTPPSPLPEPASEEEVRAFLDWLHKQRRKIPRYLDQTALDEMIPARFKKSMGAIGLRIMMDMVRGPVSRKGQEPRGDAPSAAGSRPAARTTARRTRSKRGKKRATKR